MPEGSKSPTEIISTRSRTVACDGGDGAYGHPKVFLRISPDLPEAQIMCPYCSRLFVLEGSGSDTH
jgi:uncharacterized Zn-finger protein